MSPYEYRYRGPRADIVERGGPARPRPRIEHRPGITVHRDVPVATRSGRVIWADVFLPADGTPAPAIASWTPYGKENPAPIGRRFPTSGVSDDQLSDLVSFEAPDPVFWVGQGYAIVAADMTGLWHSTGPAHFMAPEEAEDYYDLIEWIGTQPWCTGKVGLSGVSYLAVSQWRVAELAPPHLAAINPWEGWTDTYREVVTHGGIPETFFWPYIWDRWGATKGEIEDLEVETREHPWLDEFWKSKASELERITVPALVTASWSDQGLHTRGTLEGFRRISSDRKWLFVHGRKKWAEYYSEEGLARQRAFFDRFLKDVSNDVDDWSPVTLEIRDDHYVGSTITSDSWPLPDIVETELFLGDDGTLVEEQAGPAGTVSYDGLASGASLAGRAVFEHRFAVDTTIVGHARASIWVEAPEASDIDIFLGLFKRRRDGSIVGFPYYALFDDGPVALGWLRASHREKDEERSLPFLAVLKHERALPLESEGPTRLDVEILPSGTHFAEGESLVLVVQGVDIMRYPAHLLQKAHTEYVNRGPQIIHYGGGTPSHLVLPILAR